MLTPKQLQAVDLIRKTPNTLLFGGARAGKTWAAIDFIIYLAIKFEGSRQLIARRYATDIKAAIFKGTLPDQLKSHNLVNGMHYITNITDMTITFFNGSTIICAGLDDNERVEKILGQEYATIYINESNDIPYMTAAKVSSRLSQNYGDVNRFICDLNPTTTSHWTYKMFIEGVHPTTNEPLINRHEYAWLQMSPIDNKENLPKDYIEKRLETLSGQERIRFLLGEYSQTSELLVFRPQHIYEWAELTEWIKLDPMSVKLVAGLDLGFDDADAFCVLAYRESAKEVWLVDEIKMRKATISELGDQIKKSIKWVQDNLSIKNHSMYIYTDTGGLGKKTAYELRQAFNLPISQAYKRDKAIGIDFLQDYINSGAFKIPKNSEFLDEISKIVWTRDNNGVITRVIDDKAYHADMLDSVLYAMRSIQNSGALDYKEPIAEGVKQDFVAKVIENLQKDSGIW